MTPVHVLLYLRLFEICFLGAIYFWLTHWFAPSRLRSVRLTLLGALLMVNLTAVVVAVSWAQVTLW